MQLVDGAFTGLPPLHLPSPGLPFRIILRLSARRTLRYARQPPELATLAGPDELLCGTMDGSNLALVSPRSRTALIAASRDMLRFSYHLRYELIEFAVFTLAARALSLIPLHAACVGRSQRGLLLMGPSGAGKSTLSLHCCLQGMQLLSEDAVFVSPDRLLAVGLPNFVHVRSESLRQLEDEAMTARIRQSPIIHRRSGVAKFEVDLRQLGCRLPRVPLAIEAIIFLSTRAAGAEATLLPLSARELRAKLAATQPYAAGLASWQGLRGHLGSLQGFELRRGQHPCESAIALRHLLDRRGGKVS